MHADLSTEDARHAERRARIARRVAQGLLVALLFLLATRTGSAPLQRAPWPAAQVLAPTPAAIDHAPGAARAGKPAA